jgi:hypothetical protein
VVVVVGASVVVVTSIVVDVVAGAAVVATATVVVVVLAGAVADGTAVLSTDATGTFGVALNSGACVPEHDASATKPPPTPATTAATNATRRGPPEPRPSALTRRKASERASRDRGNVEPRCAIVTSRVI